MASLSAPALTGPAFAEAQANLALSLEKNGHALQAETAYRQALRCSPAEAQIHANYGAFLLRQKRFKEAESTCRRAIVLAPSMVMAWSNLGVLLACLKREAEAEACYRQALRLAPDYKKARFNLGYLLLRQGLLEEGWHCLEAREWPALLAQELGTRRWLGESLAGKSVVVGAEAGYGDVIQFSRYAPMLKALGAAQVTLAVYPALKTLLQSLEGVDAVVVPGADAMPGNPDYWVPLFSLPFHFGTRYRSIPARLPYLKALPERQLFWSQQLPGDELKVGLVWRGSPAHENDADRSLPGLATLAPLWSMPGIRFVSVQHGTGVVDAACWGKSVPVLDFGHNLGDFSDTAALVSCLDLVISVDTAVAHLAGALGRPCWVLLSDYMTDWRWQATGEDSPWYPEALRLFRQPGAGDWGSVIARVSEALGSFSANVATGN